MTENKVRDVLRIIGWNRAEEGDAEGCKAIDMAMNALEEIQRYREIGTVEEFKDLKEKLPFATVKFSKNDLQEIADEIMREHEIDIQYNVKEIRNKAIDEFADKVKELIIVEAIPTFYWAKIVDELAEQMKGGAE